MQIQTNSNPHPHPHADKILHLQSASLVVVLLFMGGMIMLWALDPPYQSPSLDSIKAAAFDDRQDKQSRELIEDSIKIQQLIDGDKELKIAIKEQGVALAALSDEHSKMRGMGIGAIGILGLLNGWCITLIKRKS